MSAPLSLETVDDAAKLIACGLQPRLRPASSPEYAELLRRYTHDGILRRCAEAIARGLGLQILGHTSQGLVLGADEDGPFATRLSDYRKNMSYEERVCHGLIHLAIAAWCFPTAAQLEDDDSTVGARFSSAKIVQFLVDVCDELHKRSEQDAEARSPELRDAWRLVRERPETRTTPDGRRTAHTLHGMVEQALEALERGGLVRKSVDPDGNNWQALGAYRLHVRELAAYKTYQIVRAASSAVVDRG